MGKPPGYVYSTYSGENLDTLTAYYFVSFKMKEDWSLGIGDFYPALKTGRTYVYKRFAVGDCANGKPADACVTVAHKSESITMPKSDMSNITGGTDYAPVVTTVWPVCTSGWALLGD